MVQHLVLWANVRNRQSPGPPLGGVPVLRVLEDPGMS